MEVVINKCYGGYSLSDTAIRWLRDKGHPKAFECTIKGEKWPGSDDVKDMKNHCYPEIERHDPLLVECVKTLGKKANGEFASLEVITIPDGVEYTIEDYDGHEWVAEKHQTWS